MAIYAYESELANVMTMCRYYLVSWTAIICFSELKHDLPWSVQYLHGRAAFSFISECAHSLNGLQEFSDHRSPARSWLRWPTKLIRLLAQNSGAYYNR